MQHYLSATDMSDLTQMRYQKQRRGSGGYTLCQTCNNLTGAWYAESYVDWAHQGMRLRSVFTQDSNIVLPFFIFPARVAKQIMAMFASTCGERLFGVHPSFRKYVLDKHARGLESGITLHCYMIHRNSNKSRATGVVGYWSGESIHTFAEVSFPPFGYILSLNSPPPHEDLLDITFFFTHAYDDWRELSMPVPLRHIASYFPGDFRSENEWKEAHKSLLGFNG